MHIFELFPIVSATEPFLMDTSQQQQPISRCIFFITSKLAFLQFPATSVSIGRTGAMFDFLSPWFVRHYMVGWTWLDEWWETKPIRAENKSSTHTHTGTCANTYKRRYTYTHKHTHTQAPVHMYVYAQAYAHTDTQKHRQVRVHRCTHTCAGQRTHTHTRRQAHTYTPPWLSWTLQWGE